VKLHGAIDNFSIQNSEVMIGGWAYCSNGSHRFPVDAVRTEGIEPKTQEFFSRGDFEQPNRFGFRVRFDGVENLLDLVWGESRCILLSGESQQAIEVWNKRHNEILAAVLAHKAGEIEEGVLCDLASKLVSEIKRRKADSVMRGVQELLVDTGMTAFDGSAVLGRKGYFFLSGGKNSVAQLYEKPLPERVLASWDALIRRRYEQFNQHGIKFVQLIIPEKQSVLTSYYPDPLVAPTPALRSLTSRLASVPAFLDAYKILLGVHQQEGLSPFRQVDSHLSFHGAMYLAQAICKHLSEGSLTLSKPELFERLVSGDLGNKFAFGNFLERILLPALEDWDFANVPITLVKSYDPVAGHTGARREWINERPLIDKSVVVFGNSMFERGGSPLGLSWWFARIFRSTVFLWSSTINSDLIEQKQPDYVVAQTVERFLTSVPPY
jgi:hypothetical protein